MMQNKLKNSLLGLLVILLSLPSLSYALDSDKNAKLYITADKADLNRSHGVGTFKGDVKIDRGTTHVRGLKVTTQADDKDQLTEVIVHGTKDKPATYETLPKEGKPILHAQALVIKYYPQQHYILLIGTAIAQQGADSITGPYLKYDSAKETLVALDPDSHHAAKPQRTTIVILPEKHQQLPGNKQGKAA